MAGGDVHTVHRDGRWVNEVEGQPCPIDDTFESQEDAAHAGRDIARDLGVGHQVHPGEERHHGDGHGPSVVPAHAAGDSGPAD